MSFLEQEMRKIIENSRYCDKATFLGALCYVKTEDYIRMRLEFAGDGGFHYDGIKMTMINYREGEVDSYTVKFSDILGLKGHDDPLCRGGLSPHIWNDGGELEWYLYHPEQSEYMKIAEVVDRYADLFQWQESAQEPQLKM